MELKNFGSENTHIRAYSKNTNKVAAFVQMVTGLADQNAPNGFNLPKVFEGKIGSH